MADSLTDPTRGERKRVDAPGGLLEGRVVKLVTSGPQDGMVWVVVDREPGSTPRGPCPWPGYGGADPGPQEGDRAWVQRADSTRLIVVAWWPL